MEFSSCILKSRKSKVPGSNPRTVESVSFSTERFQFFYNLFKLLIKETFYLPLHIQIVKRLCILKTFQSILFEPFIF